MFNNCINGVTTNSRGIPYLRTVSVAVSAESVDFALGFQPVPRLGLLWVNIANAIPAGTTGTLPVRLSLNGTARNLTFFGGANVTAANLAGTGDLLVAYNFFNGTLQLLSVNAAPAAAAAASAPVEED